MSKKKGVKMRKSLTFEQQIKLNEQMEKFNKYVVYRYYVGTYQNWWEKRNRFFCVSNGDEIPASANLIKRVSAKNRLQAFKNFRNKLFL